MDKDNRFISPFTLTSEQNGYSEKGPLETQAVKDLIRNFQKPRDVKTKQHTSPKRVAYLVYFG